MKFKHYLILFCLILSAQSQATLAKNDLTQHINQAVSSTTKTLTAIDSTWVSGPENVILSWQNKIIIPSVAGLLTFELAKNGQIKSKTLVKGKDFSIGQVQKKLIAGHYLNKVKLFDYNGSVLNEVFQTQVANLLQVPFSSSENCFYWVNVEKITPKYVVQKLCQKEGLFEYKNIVRHENLIKNIIALPDNKLITVTVNNNNSLISLFEEINGVYQLHSTQPESKYLSALDLEFKENYLYLHALSPDNTELNEYIGMLRYKIENNSFTERLAIHSKVSEVIGIDSMAITPYGVAMAENNKIKHFYISQGKVSKVVSVKVSNHVSAIYVHGDYLVTILRDPPSAYVTNKKGPAGVHIYHLKSIL
ncbi:MAG: hypothetical protein HRT53_13455 [Colwellia sp.]|nr:hypothetical protein [Colwellia sp.]